MKKYYLSKNEIVKILGITFLIISLLEAMAAIFYMMGVQEEHEFRLVFFHILSICYFVYNIIILFGYLAIDEKKIVLRSGLSKKVICWETISQVDVLKIITPSNRKNGKPKIRELVRIVSKLEGYYIAINFEFKDTDKAIHCILEECKRRGNIEIDPEVYELLERMS